MDKEIRWSAPEFHYYQKDVSWYWLVLLITVIIVGFALWQGNFLFAVFIIMASVLTLIWGKRTPKTIDFILSGRGLDIGGKKLYTYDSFNGFAIIPNDDEPELSELIFKTKKQVNPWLRVIIATQRADDVKNLLSKFIPEIEYQESLSDRISKFLRF